MKLRTNKLKFRINKGIILLVTLSILSCRSEPNKCVDLKASQAELEANLSMYETVWDKIINGRQIDLINSSSFDEGVTAVATSEGNVVGLENFKNYYSWL